MRSIRQALRTGVARGVKRDQLLRTLTALVGERGLDEALEVAVEAAKLGLRVEDLMPMVAAWHDLRILDLNREPMRQGFFAWATTHGFTTQMELAAAQALDLLRMHDDEDQP